MKRITTILILFILLLSACNNQEPTATPEPATAVPPTAEPTEAVAEEPAEETVAEVGYVTDNPWQWVSFTSPVEQFDVETPDRYRVLFNDDGTVNIVADCNNASGEYEDAPGSFTITVGPATLAACTPDSRSDQFITYLGSAAIYFFEDGNLHLDLMADGGTMVLAPSDNSNMVAEGEGSVSGGLAVPGLEMLDECFVEPSEESAESVADIEIECGYVIVPEFYSQPSDKTLKISFTRLNAREETDDAPLFMLAGGPGQTIMSSKGFDNFSDLYLGSLLDTHDIILLDQRGVKYTEPYLDCPAYHELPWTALEQGVSEQSLWRETLQNCVDELEAQGVNFDAFNAIEIANDIDAARQVLGYDRIFYYGGSWGAQLGQHVMREFPEMLEGVLLDGSNSLSRMSWVETRAEDAQWGIDNLIARCEADEACAEAYDVQALLDEAFAKFDDGPLTYTATDPDDASIAYEIEVTKTDLANFIFKQFGAGGTAANIPYFLNLLLSNDANMAQGLGEEKFKIALESRGAAEGGLAALMHYAVTCSDDPVRSLDDLVVDETIGEFALALTSTYAEEYITACDVLGVKELPDSTDENVTLDIPTLILAGNLDINTPSYRSQIVADALPNVTFVVINGTTHVQLNASAASICPAQIVVQFVQDPTAPLDTSCAEEGAPYPFTLPDAFPNTEDGSGG